MTFGKDFFTHLRFQKIENKEIKSKFKIISYEICQKDKNLS